MRTRSVLELAQPAVAAIAIFIAMAGLASAAPGVSQAVREVVEMLLRKGGKEAAERVSREAAEQSVETAATRYGPRAVQAVADGGLELIEAGTKYGDEVMRVAVEATPAARRVLALEPERMLSLARELGGEAIEIEAKSPGLARQVYVNFGDDAAKRIAKNVPAEDLPRLVSYAEKADTPATRVVLLEAYEKEGASLFQRIPAALVVSSGLTAGMIYGVHRVTEPFQATADSIRTDPETRQRFTNGLLWILGSCSILAVVFVLAAFRLTPWHAWRPATEAKRAAEPTGKTDDTAPRQGPATGTAPPV
mgnify:CR=1 FL=1